MAQADSYSKSFLKKLGARLRALRNARGWSLEDCEDHGYKNWRHLQEVEQGKNVTLVTLIKLAKLYKGAPFRSHQGDLIRFISLNSES